MIWDRFLSQGDNEENQEDDQENNREEGSSGDVVEGVIDVLGEFIGGIFELRCE